MMDLDTIFPYCNVVGSDTQGLKTLLMQQMAANTPPLTSDEFETILTEHHIFLQAGGAGGRWQIFSIKGFTWPLYRGIEATEGTQANFEKRHIPSSLDLQEVLLPFSNFCAVHCKNQDFTEADLSGSLMTDAMLQQTIFADANLQNIDFSRANLQHASFMNANLKGCDFENCDLTGADFRGAILDRSQFAGAILTDVKY